ncbi:MAG: amidohydrolase family protein [Deltaproteobacteria bacterium]|nr:amidohydrolase family protein [Deltaproteobacteria bacterium]
MAERIGPHVWKDLIPLRRLLRAGLTVGCGSDWGPKNVFEQIALAQTHEFWGSGHRNDDDDHRVTRRQAVAMWTRDAATALDWPGIGALNPGNHADLIVLDRDIIECANQDLPATRVLRTVLGGETMFDGGEL